MAGDPYVIEATDIAEFLPSHLWKGKYEYFICIDILRGSFFVGGEWKMLIREYVVGKVISLFSYFAIPSLTSTIIYIKDYIAVVRCTYPKEYEWCFKDAGYSSEQIASRFSEFADSADNSFYVCIRPTNYNFVNLDGYPMLPDSVYNALILCRQQLLMDKRIGVLNGE